MVLTVPFSDYPAVVKRQELVDVFVSARNKHTLLSAVDLKKNVLITSSSELSPAEVKSHLESAGLHVFPGQWSEQDSTLNQNGIREAFVVAVAFRSREAMPGLWMDAFATMPTPQIVLRTMYDEFRANDEIGNVTYEEFINLAHPNVVILNPGEVATFLAQKEEC